MTVLPLVLHFCFITSGSLFLLPVFLYVSMDNFEFLTTVHVFDNTFTEALNFLRDYLSIVLVLSKKLVSK